MPTPTKSCGICGTEIYDDFFQRDTGDFHGKCYDGLKTSGVQLKMSSSDDRRCAMCLQPIAKGSIVAELLETAVAHLRCFFGTTNGRGRSLGAAAIVLSLRESSRSLRAQSNALIKHSHRVRPPLLN